MSAPLRDFVNKHAKRIVAAIAREYGTQSYEAFSVHVMIMPMRRIDDEYREMDIADALIVMAAEEERGAWIEVHRLMVSSARSFMKKHFEASSVQ